MVLHLLTFQKYENKKGFLLFLFVLSFLFFIWGLSNRYQLSVHRMEYYIVRRFDSFELDGKHMM